MAASRSVSTPSTFPASSTTATVPQRRSHMSWAARLRLSSARQVTRSLVITSATFMALLLKERLRLPCQGQGAARHGRHASGHGAVTHFDRRQVEPGAGQAEPPKVAAHAARELLVTNE